eukprot:Sspe_Gene.19298::Locus_7024_Transcript_2_3_Confidence_0.500_Length_2881::g.19298::m.19298
MSAASRSDAQKTEMGFETEYENKNASAHPTASTTGLMMESWIFSCSACSRIFESSTIHTSSIPNPLARGSLTGRAATVYPLRWNSSGTPSHLHRLSQGSRWTSESTQWFSRRWRAVIAMCPGTADALSAARKPMNTPSESLREFSTPSEFPSSSSSEVKRTMVISSFTFSMDSRIKLLRVFEVLVGITGSLTRSWAPTSPDRGAQLGPSTGAVTRKMVARRSTLPCTLPCASQLGAVTPWNVAFVCGDAAGLHMKELDPAPREHGVSEKNLPGDPGSETLLTGCPLTNRTRKVSAPQGYGDVVFLHTVGYELLTPDIPSYTLMWITPEYTTMLRSQVGCPTASGLIRFEAKRVDTEGCSLRKCHNELPCVSDIAFVGLVGSLIMAALYIRCSMSTDREPTWKNPRTCSRTMDRLAIIWSSRASTTAPVDMIEAGIHIATTTSPMSNPHPAVLKLVSGTGMVTAAAAYLYQ